MPLYIYKIKLPNDEKAQQVAKILIDQAEGMSGLSYDRSEEEVKINNYHTKRKIPGSSTTLEIYELCRTSLNNIVTKERIVQRLEGLGLKATSAGPAMSTLEAIGLFEKTDDGGIRLLSKRTTRQQVQDAVRKRNNDYERKKK